MRTSPNPQNVAVGWEAATVRGVLLTGQVLILAVSLYQSGVTVAGRLRGQRPARERSLATPRIGSVICARNEEATITGIIGDLRAQDYPAGAFAVAVAAHNCTDDTVAVARAAGATVVEVLSEAPGKIHGLRAGLQLYGEDCDLIGVFDADTRVPPNLLREVAACATGEDCLQVEVRPHAAHEWVGGGYGLGRTARNHLWWRPRAALGLGTTVSGSGFFIRPAVLAAMIGDSRTLTEDLELTARLYASGRRVAYVSSVAVTVEEPDSLGGSLRQRLRWVRGHLGVVRFTWPALVRRAVRGDVRALDMAVYLVVPTRVITRVGVTTALALSLSRSSAGLPLGLAGAAFAGEWLVPLWVVLRDRVVPFSHDGIRAAAGHGLLSLLWFPLGAWALATARMRAWDRTPRSPSRTADVSTVS